MTVTKWNPRIYPILNYNYLQLFDTKNVAQSCVWIGGKRWNGMERNIIEWNGIKVQFPHLDILRWNGTKLWFHRLGSGRNGMSSNFFIPILSLF